MFYTRPMGHMNLCSVVDDDEKCFHLVIASVSLCQTRVSVNMQTNSE